MKPQWASISGAKRAAIAVLSEKALRTRARHIGHLLAGNFGAAILSLGAIAFAARALGPSAFGALGLITVFVQAIERLVSFQTWQPLIRYGAGSFEANDKRSFAAVLKFVFLLDIATALAGFAAAVTLAYFGAGVFGWTEDVTEHIVIYACVLLVAVNGSPIGVLRLAGKFKSIAYVPIVTMGSRLLLSAIGFFLEWDLRAFVAIWAVTHAYGLLAILFRAAGELRKRGQLDFLKEPLGDISARFPKIWRFSIVANLGLTIRVTSQQLDTLIVGALVDPAMAGFYHIAKRIGKAAEQAGMQIQSVVFPELAKLWAAGERIQFKKTVLQTEIGVMAIGALGVIVVTLAAPTAIRSFFGEEFSPAATFLTVQIIAVAFLVAGNIARAGLLTLGREMLVLNVTIFCAVAFFASAPLLIVRFGAIGANYAHVIQSTIFLVSVWTAFNLAFQKEDRQAGDK